MIAWVIEKIKRKKIKLNKDRINKKNKEIKKFAQNISTNGKNSILANKRAEEHNYYLMPNINDRLRNEEINPNFYLTQFLTG